MNAYIDYSISKGCRVFMSKQAMENLSQYEPKGCPFKDYTLLDLVKDLMAFSWKITKSMSLADYIRLLQAENYIYAVAYGDAIIKCLEA